MRFHLRCFWYGISAPNVCGIYWVSQVPPVWGACFGGRHRRFPRSLIFRVPKGCSCAPCHVRHERYRNILCLQFQCMAYGLFCDEVSLPPHQWIHILNHSYTLNISWNHMTNVPLFSVYQWWLMIALIKNIEFVSLLEVPYQLVAINVFHFLYSGNINVLRSMLFRR